MKPIFQLIFNIISLITIFGGAVLIGVSLITGTPSLMHSLIYFSLGIIMAICLSTSAALSTVMGAFASFLNKLDEQIEQKANEEHNIDHVNGSIRVRGISPDEIDDMPDDHPLKKILSSLGVIESKSGKKRNISDMTLDELREELKAEEADDKQDFEKCVILRDEIKKREEKGEV